MSSSQQRPCLICWETFSDLTSCSRCNIAACRECMKKFLLSKIAQGLIDENFMACPNFRCAAPLMMNQLEAFIGPDACAKLAKMRAIARVNRDPRLRWCPNAECGAVVRLPPRLLPRKPSRGTKCQNCNEAFCSRCGGKPHPGRCQRDAMYSQWAEQAGEHSGSDGVQECPRCHHHIEKRGGCKHMSCTMCGAAWCWSCRLPWHHHHIGLCRVVRKCRERGWTDSPAKRTATIAVALPLGLCAGAVAVGVGSVIGAGWVAGVVTYTAVLVPGKRAKDRVRRKWQERKAAAERVKASRHGDVPEDVMHTRTWKLDLGSAFEIQ